MVRFNDYHARIPVTDLRRTIDFYTQTLGFCAVLTWPVGPPASFCFLDRDQVRVCFTLLSAYGGSGAPTPCELHFEVDDIRGLEEALKDKSIIEWGPEAERDQDGDQVGWTFAVRDPDGHYVIFFEPTDQKEKQTL
jgi:catechol 2,3-dioxygenase-like lactoylglutathione lyase family enzyme